MPIFIDIVKGNSVYEYGSYYLQNYTYYAYICQYLVPIVIHQGHGCSSAAQNMDGGKLPPMCILSVLSKLISIFIKSSVKNLLELIYGLIPKGKMSNMVPLT